MKRATKLALAVAVPGGLVLLGGLWVWKNWFGAEGTLSLVSPTIEKQTEAGFKPVSDAEARRPSFWKTCGASRAKNYIGLMIMEITANPGLQPWITAAPSAAAFKAEFEKLADEFLIHPDILRGNQIIESGFNPQALAMNPDSTALGLGQFVKKTAAGIGIPWPEMLNWRTALRAEAMYLRQCGWPKDRSFLPTRAQVLQAEQSWKQFRKVPKWYKAICSYKTADLDESWSSGKARLLQALEPGIWSCNPKEDWLRLNPANQVFFEGKATSVKG